jgi:hypothetical protein
MDDAVPIRWKLRAIAAAAVIPPLLELVSLTRFEHFMAAAPASASSAAPDDARCARWVDDALTGMRGPWARTCLRRAAVLFYLLRAAGRRVELCIGVRRDDDGTVLAHAWLLHDGKVYLEPEATRDIVPQYNVIARLPRSA